MNYPKVLLGALAALLMLALPALAACETPEPDMRGAALAAHEMAPIDAYLLCYQYSDYAVAVRDHRNAVEAELAFAQADTPQKLQIFILQFADSELVDEAIVKMEELVAQKEFIPYPNSAFIGAPLAQPAAADAGQCQTACASAGGCQGFTFDGNGPTCTLWASIDGRGPRGGLTSGALETVPLGGANPAPTTTPAQGNFRIRQGMEAIGNSYKVLEGQDAQQCQNACAGDQRCVAFAFDIASGSCALKANLSGTQDNPQFLSGMKITQGGPQSQAQVMEVYPDMDLENPRGSPNDFSILSDTSAAQCQQLCQGDNRCRAFTHNGQANACILKSDFAQAVGFSGATSGLKP